MAWTLLQKQLASIFPHITGFISWLGSLSIVVDVIHKQRSSSSSSKPTAYHRLMLGMSFCDMCSSGAWMLSTWPVPADTPGTWHTFGNDATCKAQGYFIQMGIGVPFYNLCLAIYYHLLIVKNTKVSMRLERIMHFVSLGYAFTTAIASAVMDLLGYATFWCWIEGKHKMLRWLFWYGPLWAIILAVTLIMSSIYWKVLKQEKRQGRFTFVATAGATSNDDGNSNRQGRFTFRASTTGATSNDGPNTSASDSVKWQASWYLGSFFITWIFLTIVRGMQTAGNKAIPYWVILAAVTLCPSQGFFNFIIYIKPRYKSYRKRHPDVGRVAAFFCVMPLNCCRLSSAQQGSRTTYRSSRFFRSSPSRLVSSAVRRSSLKRSSAAEAEMHVVEDGKNMSPGRNLEESCGQMNSSQTLYKTARQHMVTFDSKPTFNSGKDIVQCSSDEDEFHDAVDGDEFDENISTKGRQDAGEGGEVDEELGC